MKPGLISAASLVQHAHKLDFARSPRHANAAHFKMTSPRAFPGIKNGMGLLNLAQTGPKDKRIVQELFVWTKTSIRQKMSSELQNQASHADYVLPCSIGIWYRTHRHDCKSAPFPKAASDCMTPAAPASPTVSGAGVSQCRYLN